MIIRNAAKFALLPALFLAGCGDDPAPDSSKTGDAGELTGGTISDDMLPLAEIRSQAPTVKAAPTSDSGDDSSGDTDTASATEDSSADADTGASSDAEEAGGDEG